MRDVLLGVAGIMATLATFWLGYRQTIGARQERIRAANDDIETTLLKRIVLEGYGARWEQLAQFIAGKALTARVALSDLRAPDQVMSVVVARLLEDDLISPQTRRDLLSDIKSFNEVHGLERRAAEFRSSSTPRPTEASRESQRLVQDVALMLGLVSAGVGTVVALATSTHQGKSGSGLTTVIAVVATGLTAAAAGSGVLLRQRAVRLSESSVRIGEPNAARLREFETYPPEEETKEALQRLESLSPLAVGTLRYFGEDVKRSARLGGPEGMFARRGGTPWSDELIRAGLIRVTESVSKDDPDLELFVLTDEGAKLARVLTAHEPVPSYLLPDVSADVNRPPSSNGGPASATAGG